MRLHKAAVLLRLDPLQDLIPGNWPEAQPWRNLTGEPGSLCATENQLATIWCVQVVPVFAQVAMTMSSFRNRNSFQRVESLTKFCTSRIFCGHARAACCMQASPYADLASQSIRLRQRLLQRHLPSLSSVEHPQGNLSISGHIRRHSGPSPRANPQPQRTQMSS